MGGREEGFWKAEIKNWLSPAKPKSQMLLPQAGSCTDATPSLRGGSFETTPESVA